MQERNSDDMAKLEAIAREYSESPEKKQKLREDFNVIKQEVSQRMYLSSSVLVIV